MFNIVYTTSLSVYEKYSCFFNIHIKSRLLLVVVGIDYIYPNATIIQRSKMAFFIPLFNSESHCRHFGIGTHEFVLHNVSTRCLRLSVGGNFKDILYINPSN